MIAGVLFRSRSGRLGAMVTTTTLLLLYALKTNLSAIIKTISFLSDDYHEQICFSN